MAVLVDREVLDARCRAAASIVRAVLGGTRSRARPAGRRGGSPNKARRNAAVASAERHAHDVGARCGRRSTRDRLGRDRHAGAAARSRPRSSSTRVALGESWMPAPVSSSRWRLLQHDGAKAGARQRQRGGQAADPGAGDDRWCGNGPRPRSRRRRAVNGRAGRVQHACLVGKRTFGRPRRVRCRASDCSGRASSNRSR